jgi:hypothetical protein
MLMPVPFAVNLIIQDVSRAASRVSGSTALRAPKRPRPQSRAVVESARIFSPQKDGFGKAVGAARAPAALFLLTPKSGAVLNLCC